MTELENALSSVDTDAIPAVQRYAVVETQLVSLVAVLQVRTRSFNLYTAIKGPSTLAAGLVVGAPRSWRIFVNLSMGVNHGGKGQTRSD